MCDCVGVFFHSHVSVLAIGALLLCYVMSLYFLTTDQWVPSVRSNDTREWNEINAAATYRIASPPLVSENEAPCPFATRQWRQARTWQDAPLPPRRLVDFCSIIKPFIHALSQPCPLQGVVRVRARAWRVRGRAWDVGCRRHSCGIGSHAPSWPSRAWRLMLSVRCLLPPFLCWSESAVASLHLVRFFLYPALSVRLCAGVRGCVVCLSVSHR